MAKMSDDDRAVAREMKEALAKGERAFKKVNERCEDVTDKEAECAMTASTLDAYDLCIK
jgi:hypothetical protein